MRTLPLEITQEFAKDAMHMQHLVTLTTDSAVYRWTDGSNAIYYAGQWYISKGLTFKAVTLSLGADRLRNIVCSERG